MKISVIIPVKNGAQTLKKCLSSIRSQTTDNIEIIILDSKSSDDSKEIALQYGTKVIDIPEGEFNHGLSRNIGAREANGDYLFYTVQDAWLSENSLLEKMAKHFEDEKVMGVVGHQAIPWGEDDKNPAYWFKRYSLPEVHERYFPGGSFDVLSQNEQFNLSGWDDVVAMYRRTVFEIIPFRNTNFSEDWLWAFDALKKGFKLISDPSVIVYHYHHLKYSYRFKTQFTVNYYFYKYFKTTPQVPLSPMKFLRAGHTILTRNEVAFLKKPYWLMHNLGINFADFTSNLIFRTALTIGGTKLLERVHFFFCSKVPQGKLKENG